MKLSSILIEKFRHLENLAFDFTYQSGERKGQPLDKICFMGQSATGKTTLLELIYEFIQEFKGYAFINENQYIKINENLINLDIQIDFEINHKKYNYSQNKLNINGKEITLFEGNYNGGLTSIEKQFNLILYITSEILSQNNIKLFEEDTIYLIEKWKKLENYVFFATKYNEKVDEHIWLSLLDDILKYRQNFLQFATDLINSGNILNESSQEKVDIWKKQNHNPLQEFSEKFDIILEKINLEIDIHSTQNIIPLRNKITNENIPIKNISTGTKQLLLTALPLYELKNNETLILIDEPERSLYPDMQMDLMEYYQNLAPNAQFVVATHSPFIVASFEPDERFILYYDNEGKVAVRRGTSPQGDDPNDMLYKDFGVNYINKFGLEVYEHYVDLKQKIYFEKDETVKNKYIKEAEKLGELYNF